MHCPLFPLVHPSFLKMCASPFHKVFFIMLLSSLLNRTTFTAAGLIFQCCVRSPSTTCHACSSTPCRSCYQALYRAIYKTTRAENIAAVPNDTAFVGAGTIIGVLCGFGLFKGIGALMSKFNEHRYGGKSGKVVFALIPFTSRCPQEPAANTVDWMSLRRTDGWGDMDLPEAAL